MAIKFCWYHLVSLERRPAVFFNGLKLAHHQPRRQG